MEDSKMLLETYKAQLAQVELAITSGQNDQDLLVLQNEMKELIALTEESLISYEKSKLMSMLNGDEQDDHADDAAASDDMEDEMARFYADLDKGETTSSGTFERNGEPPNSSQRVEQDEATPRSDFTSVEGRRATGDDRLNEEFLETIENCEDISGTRCRAPHSTEWSGSSYYNAMIMDVEKSDEQQEDDVLVRVLFLNPVMEQMRPCPYLLEGTCKFDADQCKFSHGHLVSLYTLRKFKEPEFRNFSIGSTCLAKHTDALWCVARVEEILEDHKYSVKFMHRNATGIVDVSDILPCDNDDDVSSDSDGSDVVILDVGLSYTATRQKIDLSKVGSWEEHTRGIGSKIMMKFGYTPGEGLGKDGQGRVEPVPVVVLPAGKSLDHCMKLKERKMELSEKVQQFPRKHHPPSVFHFLNKTLGDRKTKTDAMSKLTKKKDLFGIKECGVTSHRKKLSSQLLQNDNEIKRLKARVGKLRESVARNKVKNPNVAKQLQVKLDQALADLRNIQSSSRVIEAHQTRSDTHRKMTKF